MTKRKFVVRIQKDKLGRYVLIKGKKYRIGTKQPKRIAKAIVKKLKKSYRIRPNKSIAWRKPRSVRKYRAAQALEPFQPIVAPEGVVALKTKTRAEKEAEQQKKIEKEKEKQEREHWEWQAKELGIKVKKRWDLDTLIEKVNSVMEKSDVEHKERQKKIGLIAQIQGLDDESILENLSDKQLDKALDDSLEEYNENLEIITNLTGKSPDDFADWSLPELQQRIEALAEESKVPPAPPTSPAPVTEWDKQRAEAKDPALSAAAKTYTKRAKAIKELATPPVRAPRAPQVMVPAPDPLALNPIPRMNKRTVFPQSPPAAPLGTPAGTTTSTSSADASTSSADASTTPADTTEGAGKHNIDKVGLSNHQIDEIMKPYPEYLGCIANDEIESRILPKVRPRSRGCFVINTKPSSHRGEHWQCVYFDARPSGDNTMEFFDSYGDPADENVLKGLKLIADKLDAKTYLKFKENRIEKQGDSNNCGFFCTQFLIDRLRGKPFIDASGWKDVHGGEKDVEKFKTQLGFGYMPSFGGGILDTLKGAISNVSTAVRNVFFPSSKMPNASRAVLERYGRANISRIQIRRAPVVPMVEKFLNIISLGEYEKGKAEANYDKMFHLGIVFHLFTGPKILAEKNETINITTSFSDDKNTEYMDVPLNTKDLTLNQIMKKTEDYMGTFNFYQYNAFSNNCQTWVLAVLTANGLNNPTLQAFVKQPVDTIVKRLPSFVGKVAQFATDTWARIKQMFGRSRKIQRVKFNRVMREFKAGRLRSSSGKLVTNPKQALAIAYSESKKVSKN